MSKLFRNLPSVDAALDALAGDERLAAAPRAQVRELVNAFLDVCRQEIRDGVLSKSKEVGLAPLLPRMTSFVRAGVAPKFKRVLNATGVVVHTNLGRSLLCRDAIEAVNAANGAYSNLEFNLKTGHRGSRYSHVEEIVCRISGAEAALVVNNNAAAVLLTLDTLCKGREVIVSRGQLVEIGGSFRIPAVMEKSGAKLREVGATNRTHLKDYESAICDDTAALMKVHTSNFRIVGFHKEVPLTELVELGRRYNLPVIEDLGSGNFYDFSALGLGHEPTVQQVNADGADVITFSGDKVLGGPQAGIIIGRKEYIDRIKSNPMNRALRIDKMTLAALEATLRLYLDPERARAEVPTLRMITATAEQLRDKAKRLRARLMAVLGEAATVTLRRSESRVGGGAFPERGLHTTLVRVEARNTAPDALRERLLATDPPLVGRIEDEAFCLDPRTLDGSEFSLAAEAIKSALEQV